MTAKKNERKKLEFTLGAVEKKPSRRYRKGSQYDPILDQFLESNEKLVNVEIAGKEPNYIRTQLNNRIKAREIKNVKISVVSNVCYAERTDIT